MVFIPHPYLLLRIFVGIINVSLERSLTLPLAVGGWQLAGKGSAQNYVSRQSATHTASKSEALKSPRVDDVRNHVIGFFLSFPRH